MSKWILAALATALFALAAGFFVSGGLASPANAQTITVYKTPWCGCCTAWIKHLQRDGLEVRVIEREDLAPVRASLNVPDELASCHTASVDGYAIEGHVPASEIRKLLETRPDAAGFRCPACQWALPEWKRQARLTPMMSFCLVRISKAYSRAMSAASQLNRRSGNEIRNL